MFNANQTEVFKKSAERSTGTTIKVEMIEAISTTSCLNYLSLFGFVNASEKPFKYRKLYMVYSLLTKFCVYLLFPFSFGVVLTQASKFELAAVLIVIESSFNVFGTAMKALFLNLMVSRLHSVNAIFNELDARCKDEDEVKEQMRAVRIGRKITSLFMGLYYFFSASRFFGSILEGRLPYSVYLPVIDSQRSTLEFCLALFFELITFNLIVAQSIFNDAYAAVYIAILGAHVRILLLRVSKLGKCLESSNEEDTETLKGCIRDHQLILKIRDSIAPLISKTIFLQYLIMAMACSTILLNVTVLSTSTGDRLASVIYILAISCQSFPTCFYSALLEEDSNRLATEIFGSQWYTRSFEYRKTILNFIHQSQQTIKFRAGKMFDISLQMFISVAKFSFSLYTFANTMDLKTKLGF